MLPSTIDMKSSSIFDKSNARSFQVLQSSSGGKGVGMSKGNVVLGAHPAIRTAITNSRIRLFKLHFPSHSSLSNGPPRVCGAGMFIVLRR